VKALSLLQPWASLVAWGEKWIETRSWRASYSGPLAIHASKRFAREDIEMCLDDERFKRAIGKHAKILADLPLGSIIAVARLDFVGPIENHGPDGWHIDRHDERGRYIGHRLVSDQERAFGNYDEGRFGWVFTSVARLPEPIPCRGALGLWDVPPEIEAEVVDALGGPAQARPT
jgi:hypothetical protein